MAKNILHIDEDHYKYLSLGNWDFRYLRMARSFNSLSGEFLPLLYKFPCTFLQRSPTNSLIDYQNLLLDNNNSRGILPMAVRYVDTCGNYYIERPPFKIPIDYKNDRAYENNPREFVKSSSGLEMWVPWTIMVIPGSFANSYDVSGVKLYFSHKSLESMSDTYLHMFLPNSYMDSRICMSASFDHVVSLATDRAVGEAFDWRYWHSLILNDYMLGGWNSDLDSNLLKKIDSLDLEDDRIVNILKSYSILDSYVNIKDYPSIFESAANVCQSYFGCTKKRSRNILYGIKVKKYDWKDHYVKFFSFISLLSLEDTLSFYKQIQDVLGEIDKLYSRSEDRGYFYYAAGGRSTFQKIVEDAVKTFDSQFNSPQIQTPIAHYGIYAAKNPSYDQNVSYDAYSINSIYFYLDNYSPSFLDRRVVLTNNDSHHLYDPIELLEHIDVDISYLLTTLKKDSLSSSYSDCNSFFFKIDVGLKSIVAIPIKELDSVLDKIALSVSDYITKEGPSFSMSEKGRRKSRKTDSEVRSFYDIEVFGSLDNVKSLFNL